MRRLPFSLWMLLTALLGGVGSLQAPAEEPSLFPDPMPDRFPVTTDISLRELATALRTQRVDEASMRAFQLLALMAREKERGLSQSEFLANRYRSEKLSPAESVPVQRCLLTNWYLAQRFGLFTPNNLAAMERGEPPVISQGPKTGQACFFQAESAGTPPEFILTLVPRSAYRPLPKVASPDLPLPLPSGATAPPAAVSTTPVLKTLEVRLGEKTSLDALGLPNFDLRLDRIERDRQVSFLIEDRTAIHYRLVPVWNAAENRYVNRRERADNAARTATFLPQKIPGTNTLGVRLGAFGPVTIYLDENLGAQVTYRLYFRIAAPQ